MTRFRPVALLAGAVCLAAFAGSVAAQPLVVREGFSSDPARVLSHARLSYSAADLATPAAASAFLQRIEAAADAVCGGAANKITVYDKADYETCRSEAISGAVARLGSPVVAALVAERTKVGP